MASTRKQGIGFGKRENENSSGDEAEVLRGTAMRDKDHDVNTPAWKQEVRDDQGRRRFHGAFTGGYSAGYFNTVGSQEGWKPATFSSSRSSRTASKQQNIKDFMDEEDLNDGGAGVIECAGKEYSVLGATAGEMANRAAVAAKQVVEDQGRLNLIPDELFDSAPQETIGTKLLFAMGWRRGHEMGSIKRWRSDPVERQKIRAVVYTPKTNLYGLGYNAVENAPEFLAHHQSRMQAEKQGKKTILAGSYDEDDDDERLAYDTGDKSSYFTSLGDDDDENVAAKTKPTNDLFVGSAKNAQQNRRGFDGRPALPGFVLSSAVVNENSNSGTNKNNSTNNANKNGGVVPTHFPPPVVPPNFSEKHVFAEDKGKDASTTDSTKKGPNFNLTADKRREILGERKLPGQIAQPQKQVLETPLPQQQTIFSLLPPQDCERLVTVARAYSDALRGKKAAAFAGETSTSTNDQTQFQPYAKTDPEMQKRYEQFLTHLSEKSMPPPYVGTAQTQGIGSMKEHVMFARVAIYNQPVKNVLASRFTSVSSATPTPEQASAYALSSTPSTQTQATQYIPRAEPPRKKMFGKETRKEVEWRPCKLLCKRMNIKDPYVDQPQVAPRKESVTLVSSNKVGIIEVSRDAIAAMVPALGAPPVPEIKPTTFTTAETLVNQIVEDIANHNDNDNEIEEVVEKPSIDLFKAIFAADSDSDEDTAKPAETPKPQPPAAPHSQPRFANASPVRSLSSSSSDSESSQSSVSQDSSKRHKRKERDAEKRHRSSDRKDRHRHKDRHKETDRDTDKDRDRRKDKSRKHSKDERRKKDKHREKEHRKERRHGDDDGSRERRSKRSKRSHDS